MTTETILTPEQIEKIRHQTVMAFDGTKQPFDVAARAIEQAVLQSPETQRLREDAKRLDALRAHGI